MYLSFITDQKSKKSDIIEIIKNIESGIHICSAEKTLTSGQAVGFLSNLNLSNINLAKCLENSTKLSLQQDEDCKKFIFLITDNFTDILNYNIQKCLNLDKKLNLFENFCNFYFVTSKEILFDHPSLNIIKNLSEIDFKKILN